MLYWTPIALLVCLIGIGVAPVVVGGLGFVGVGDGLGADLEVALGRGQLLGGRGLLGARRFQRVLGRQHVEVGLGHARDQVLLGLGELGLRDGLLQLALLVGFP